MDKLKAAEGGVKSAVEKVGDEVGAVVEKAKSAVSK